MKSTNPTLACIILLLFCAAKVSSAQDQSYLHNRTVMERAVVAGAGGQAMPLGNMAVSTPGTVGDVYLVPDYRVTTFWLYDENKMVKDYAARLDLQRNEFDIMMGSSVRALSGANVKTLMWTDGPSGTRQYFVNAQEYKNEDDVPYLGFFQILTEGELTLLKMTQVKFKPADHNPTHNTGIKDNRFLKTVELYLANGTKAAELPNRKGILKLMESHKDEVNKFMEVNEISLRNERHLVTLFDYYNSLVKK